MARKQTARDRLPEVEAALTKMFGHAPTHAQIAAVLGKSRGRVSQIKSTDRPTMRDDATDALRAAIMRARGDLQIELGREPMLTEVAAATGLYVQAISRAYLALGLDTKAGRRAARDQRRVERARAVIAALDGEDLGPV